MKKVTSPMRQLGSEQDSQDRGESRVFWFFLPLVGLGALALLQWMMAKEISFTSAAGARPGTILARFLFVFRHSETWLAVHGVIALNGVVTFPRRCIRLVGGAMSLWLGAGLVVCALCLVSEMIRVGR